MKSIYKTGAYGPDDMAGATRNTVNRFDLSPVKLPTVTMSAAEAVNMRMKRKNIDRLEMCVEKCPVTGIQ